jgi:hypothetical protein
MTPMRGCATNYLFMLNNANCNLIAIVTFPLKFEIQGLGKTFEQRIIELVIGLL